MPGGQSFTRQIYYAPSETGFNLQDIDSAADGTFVNCDGYNQLTAFLFHDYAAATGVQAYAETKDDQGVASYIMRDDDEGGGVYTSYRWKRQYTTGADRYWVWNFRINAKQFRLSDVVGQGSPSGDKLSVSYLLAAL